MQQIKCASCEFTKFFVNSIEGTSLISCCECGASFIVGTSNPEPETKPVQEKPKPTEGNVEEAKKHLEKVKLEQEKEPEETIEPEIQEKVVEPKAVARKLTPEEKQELLLAMEKGD